MQGTGKPTRTQTRLWLSVNIGTPVFCLPGKRYYHYTVTKTDSDSGRNGHTIYLLHYPDHEVTHTGSRNVIIWLIYLIRVILATVSKETNLQLGK